MIHEVRILVKTTTRMSRKSVIEMLDTCLKSTENSMVLPFKVQDVMSLDNRFLKDLREAKIGSVMIISTHDRTGYKNFATSMGLDVVFRNHPDESKLKLYVIDTLW